MRYTTRVVLGVVLVIALVSVNAAAATYSIPADKVNIQKVYYGNATAFDKPGKVDYESVIKATPEYGEVKKKRIEPGTGKYWILLSQASERAVRAISEVGHETGYDFIAAQAYLGGLEPTIQSEDVTPLVLDKVKDSGKNREELELKSDKAENTPKQK